MRIKERLAQSGQFISFEFFPPKEKDKWPAFFEVVGRLAPVKPLFVSVTYGAGGAAQANTLDIVARLKREFDLEPMAHLTCVGASPASIAAFLDELHDSGIDNVLALRGDPPQGAEGFTPDNEAFRHASDLTAFIRDRYPAMGVAVAGYPEKHPEAESPDKDLAWLKYKLDQGGDLAVTQLFFENQRYFDFVAKARRMGVDKPIIPGVLPILALPSVKRILSLCGASIPPDFLRALEEAEAKDKEAQDRGEKASAVRRLGVDYARRQVRELLEQGAPGVHLYTLNKAEACLEIVSDLSICGKLGVC